MLTACPLTEIADSYPPIRILLANCARMARAGRWVWPPGLAACAQPVPGVHCAAPGTGAHRQSRQQRGRLPLRGGSTLVNGGPATTKGKITTLSKPIEPAAGPPAASDPGKPPNKPAESDSGG